jgi:peroxiredoxin
MSAAQNLRLKVLLSWAIEFVERETTILEECHTIDGEWDAEEPDAQAEAADARAWLKKARAEIAIS